MEKREGKFKHNYEPEIWTCANCGEQWEASSRQVQQWKWALLKDPNRSGPYHNKSCATKANRSNGRYGKRNPLHVDDIKRD